MKGPLDGPGSTEGASGFSENGEDRSPEIPVPLDLGSKEFITGLLEFQQDLVGGQDLGALVLVQLFVGTHEGGQPIQVDLSGCEWAQFMGQTNLGVLVGALLTLQNAPNLLCGHGHRRGEGLFRMEKGSQSLGNPVVRRHSDQTPLPERSASLQR